MEHRWGRRVASDIPIRVIVPGASPRDAHLTNLSVTGAFLRLDFGVRLLSRVQIVFGSSLRPHEEPIHIAAYVVRHGGHGIGVAWCEITSPAVFEILRTVNAQSSTRIVRAEPVT